MTAEQPPTLILGGISLSGKSTVARFLSQESPWAIAFVEGDELHEPANIEKMHSGRPLDENDRTIWRNKIQALISAPPAGKLQIITCSALTRAFRDQLRGAGPVRFVLLEISRETAWERARERKQIQPTHFFQPADHPELLEGQYRDYQRPGEDEPDARTFDMSGELTDQKALETARAILNFFI